jgi:CRISPR-associated protein Csx10
MIAVTFHIRLEEPTILKALEGDPNSAVSFHYIPGSVIRGMVIAQHIRDERASNPQFELQADGPEQFVFFSPNTRYLNAYPVVEGKRGLPIPGTWMQPKYERTTDIVDSAFPSAANGQSNAKRTRLSGFTLVSDGTAYTYKSQTVINVHNTRTRQGNSSDQQVFRYEALSEGQIFAGAILCLDEETANNLADLMVTHTSGYIGRSRTAGYGRVSLENIHVDANWSETATHMIEDTMVMTFLSDTLLRDGFGMYNPSPDVLQGALAAIGVNCSVEPISMKTTWVGGFNRKWGLPLPQTIGIASGSVVRLSGLSADANVEYLLEHGLGDRREDGFGRVSLGWQHGDQKMLEQVKVAYAPFQDIKDDTVELSDESKQLRGIIRARVREHQLNEQLAGVAFDPSYTIRGNLSRTQISRIRSVIANALRDDNPSKSVLKDYVMLVEGKKAGRQLANARIGNQTLQDWLQDPKFKELSDSINNRDLYVLQLVDVVLDRAYRAREKQEKS